MLASLASNGAITSVDMFTPSQLCSLQKCLNSTDLAYFEYSGVRLLINNTGLPADKIALHIHVDT